MLRVIEQTRPMLRTLLADRFKLAVHRQPRAVPVYALVVDKSGHKLSTALVIDHVEPPTPN